MTDFTIIKENLASLKREAALLSEKRLYELSELSAAVYRNLAEKWKGEEWEEAFFGLRVPELLALFPRDPETPTEYLPFLQGEREADLSAELCAFSLFLSERIEADVSRPLPWREAERTGSRIAYIPSVWADRAFLALARIREDATVLYAESASAAVDDLLGGRADFALLPYASKTGEPLLGIERLLTQNDLAISALMTVADGEDRPIYVLASRELSPYFSAPCMLLSLSVTVNSYEHLGRILSALPLFGYQQRSFASEAEEYGRIRGRITLDGEGNAMALYLYLSIYSVGFSVLGRYPMLEI